MYMYACIYISSVSEVCYIIVVCVCMYWYVVTLTN